MDISQIFFSAPAGGRCEAEMAAFALLDELNIPYQRVEHDPADTMEDCAAISDVLGTRICKNLFLCNRQETAFYLLMMPADKPFKTKDLSAQIGSSRLSFGTPENMEKYLDITPGSVSVLGLMNDTGNAVKLLIDEDLMTQERIGCHPCINTSSLGISSADLFGKVIPALGHDVLTVKL